MWCKLLQCKYLKNRIICDPELKKSIYSSNICKGIEYGATIVEKRIQWKIGMGDRVKFWLSNFGQFYHGILFAKYVVYMLVEGLVVRKEFFGDGVIMKKGLRDTRLTVTLEGRLEDWLYSNMHDKNFAKDNIPYVLILTVTLWFLWKLRCNKVFVLNFVLPQSSHMIIEHYAKDRWAANSDDISRVTTPILVSWAPTTKNWVKLNIDGSCSSESGAITARGVMRNNKKGRIKGFVMNIGWGMSWKLNYRVFSKG
ncbi:hypothetical protein Ddye_003089 [Dipteronia dyeriana]|uniref:Uncharacterized protein n=1 Tax=Dipteronia dyeriana TaxID=168575 RepID=A0AAD9XS08_9ROSI|nr:hypothetical protein Ddye_003089 [Dipteronia dyeriana]